MDGYLAIRGGRECLCVGVGHKGGQLRVRACLHACKGGGGAAACTAAVQVAPVRFTTGVQQHTLQHRAGKGGGGLMNTQYDAWMDEWVRGSSHHIEQTPLWEGGGVKSLH